MENRSGLHPLGHAVLLKMEGTAQHKGMIEIPDTVREKAIVMETLGEVVEVGAECWSDDGPWWKFVLGIRTRRARPGDLVLITRLAGFVAKGPFDGEMYRLVNDRDIFCRTDRRD